MCVPKWHIPENTTGDVPVFLKAGMHINQLWMVVIMKNNVKLFNTREPSPCVRTLPQQAY